MLMRSGRANGPAPHIRGWPGDQSFSCAASGPPALTCSSAALHDLSVCRLTDIPAYDARRDSHPRSVFLRPEHPGYLRVAPVYLVYLYMKHRDNVPKQPASPLDPLPRVTVQLPIFNEMYVADRLIQAVCQLDYPRHLLEIQVLDDSSDETRDIAAQSVERQAERGFDITYRTAPTGGYKAGALRQDSARRTASTSPFSTPTSSRPRVPASDATALRRRQSRDGAGALGPSQPGLLTPHEDSGHPARRPLRPRARRPQPRRLLFQFQRIAGIWRHAAIDAAGGWQHDTLTEDLDLSYRAQLAGWRFVFLPDLVAPAEVPVEMNSFKSQQHRWAKGSIQTCRKLLPRIPQSDLPLAVKAEAFFHLSANFNYLLMALLSVLMFPAMWVRYNMGWTRCCSSTYHSSAATASIANFYMVSQREIYPDWKTGSSICRSSCRSGSALP